MEIVLGLLAALVAVLVIVNWGRRRGDAGHGPDAGAAVVDGDPGQGYDGSPDEGGTGDGGGDGGGGD